MKKNTLQEGLLCRTLSPPHWCRASYIPGRVIFAWSPGVVFPPGSRPGSNTGTECNVASPVQMPHNNYVLPDDKKRILCYQRGN